MLKRLIRLTVIAAVVAGVVYVVRSLRRDTDPLPSVPESGGEPWPPLRPEPAGNAATTPAEPTPAQPTPAAPPVPATPAVPKTVTPDAAWVDPDADGQCPQGYPIKAKMKSQIFHSPGQLAYDRTHPDRCYATAETAEADGLRAAKR